MSKGQKFPEDEFVNDALTAEFIEQDPEKFDAKFVVENKPIYVHKWMLKQRYPLLFHIFFDSLSSNEATIFDENISFDEFKAFLQFLYTNKIELNEENIFLFTRLAFQYAIISLQKICETYLSDLSKNVTFQNALRRIEYSEIYPMPCLRSKVFKLCIKYKSEILSIIYDLSKPIMRATLRFLSPEERFKYALEWAKFQCTAKNLEPNGENCRNELGDIFNKIEFDKMDIKFVETTVAESFVLTKIELFKLIHAKNLLNEKSLIDILTAEFDCQDPEKLDAKFLVQNKPIYAFKWLLRIQCPILLKFFTVSSCYLDISNGVIIGGNVKFDQFKAFLRYLYTNKIELNEENIYVLTDLANQYNVLSLYNRCEDYLCQNASYQNTENHFKLAALYEMAKAIKILCKYIKIKDFWETNDLLQISKPLMKACIQMQMLSKSPEEEYFKALEWAKIRCTENNLEQSVKNCRNELGDIVDVIHFDQMSPEFVSTTIAESQFLTDEERLKVLDKIAINLKLRSSFKMRLSCESCGTREVHVLTEGADKLLLQFFIEIARRQRLEFGYWYTIKEETSNKFLRSICNERYVPKSISPDLIEDGSIVLLAEFRNEKCTSIYFETIRKPLSSDKKMFGIFYNYSLKYDYCSPYHCNFCGGPRWKSAYVSYKAMELLRLNRF